jgi:HD-like signal output (HDOD) protein
MSLGHDTIITIGTSLPPGLAIFGRLQALLRDPSAELADIVKLVQVDPALTFQVIRLSNSVLYGVKTPCQSLDEAVSRVGLAELQQIVGLAVARQSFQGELELFQISAARLWENAVGVGSLMSAFAARVGGDVGAAYATGLLRNIGKVVLNNYPGGVCYPGADERPDLHAWERETHGLTAVEVSAVLLNHWRFSAATVETMRGHLAPDPLSAHAAGAAQMHLACAVAVEWKCALPGEETCWRNDAGMRALAGLREEDWAGTIGQARMHYQRIAQIEWAAAA